MVELSQDDRKQLLSLLEKLPEMREERSRRQLLIDAGLGDEIGRINVAGTSGSATREMVEFLCYQGREPLSFFLGVVRELVGLENREFLDRLLQAYCAIEPPAPSPLQQEFFEASERGECDRLEAERARQRQRKRQRRWRVQFLAGGLVLLSGLLGWSEVQGRDAVRCKVNTEIAALGFETETLWQNGHLAIEALLQGLTTLQRVETAAKNEQLDPATQVRAATAFHGARGMRSRNRLEGHSGWVRHMTYNPDGNTSASASEDGTARLWRSNGTPIATLEGHSGVVWHATYSPDGNTLASASADGTVRLWRSDGTPIATLEGHSDMVRYATYSPNGNTIASASDDDTVRLWRSDGSPIATLKGHSGSV